MTKKWHDSALDLRRIPFKTAFGSRCKEAFMPEPQVTSASNEVAPLYTVGLGASAGGLEALLDFLEAVPKESGLAYVIVQHMDPNHKGMLIELLQKVTSLPVVQVSNHMRVERDHIYVIPPGQDLSILQGSFYLTKPVESRGLRLPVDFFFQSLAQDQGPKSIAVILSGMGSDGTLGIKVIKDHGGFVFAQTPVTAKFESMPQSAISSGLVDHVAMAEDIPSKILELIAVLPAVAADDVKPPKVSLEIHPIIFELLRKRTNQDFSLYKKSTISRRIERRMALRQLTVISDYVEILQKDTEELDQLFRELLIGVTSFFRDAEVWKQLKSEILPMILAKHPSGATLRAWVTGCSTGEEAYSLAMAFREVIDQLPNRGHYSLQIFATDLDKRAIEKARLGFFSKSSVIGIPDDMLLRYFREEDAGYRLNKDIRETVIFAEQNLIMDPPFVKLDFLSCRNVLIYFNTALQKRIMQLFYYSLNVGGVLLLGSSETVGAATHLFSSLAGPGHFYQKVAMPGTIEFELPKFFHQAGGTTVDQGDNTKLTAPSQAAPVIEVLVGRLILQEYSPAAVLTTETGEILYISGRTGRYLEPPMGKANWSLFALAREGLNLALNEAFHRAIREKKSVTIPDVKVGSEHDIQIVDVTVQAIVEPEALRGLLLVVFTDRGKNPEDFRSPNESEPDAGLDSKTKELLQKFQRAQDALLNTRQEMQTSQEELKSTNEELQSTNEELQSTNEELMTSKEEIQSMNEELQTVNHELQAKVDELSHTSNDMKNLLNSTDIATLFLDENLNIRRFTPQAAGVIKLIPSDAGRPVTDLVSSLDYPTLADDTREVLRTLVFSEKQIASKDGRWYIVRIMPYRTVDNRIDGVVITFVNISAAKELESRLRESELTFSHAFQNALTGMAFVAVDNTWIEVNPTLCQVFGYSEVELRSLQPDNVIFEEDRGIWQSMVKKLQADPAAKSNFSLRVLHKTGASIAVNVCASVIPEVENKPSRLFIQFSL